MPPCPPHIRATVVFFSRAVFGELQRDHPQKTKKQINSGREESAHGMTASAMSASRASMTGGAEQGRLTNGVGILGQKPLKGRDRVSF